MSDNNMFCDRRVLTNEAAVEQFFVLRLLAELGYADKHIKPKTSVDELMVNIGRRSEPYAPDFTVMIGGRPRIVVEAKAPSERLEDHIGQPASYCLLLNRRSKTSNPVKYFLLTNGISTQIYPWDSDVPSLVLDFDDFTAGSVKMRQLMRLISLDGVNETKTEPKSTEATIALGRGTLDQLGTAFAWCHQKIHDKEALSQGPAFMEFVKVIFLKLLSDRDIHDKFPEQVGKGAMTVPADAVKFSVRWIEQMELQHSNPMDALQFQPLVRKLEEEIQAGQRKRIFPVGDSIRLKPDTIKVITARLETMDLFGIDADLNGRLFETFLNATMRGKDLGQFFTPRSVVKLATKLADLEAGRDGVDVVIDACCGTGGFLIEALAEMWDKLDANQSLSSEERDKLRKTVALRSIYGVDIAQDPALAQIARINMYLHGDGGSSIFLADSLDKRVSDNAVDTPEIKRDKNEFRDLVSGKGFADVALTNPPFSKYYETADSEQAKILEDYEIASGRSVAKVKSSYLFLERYYDLLKPGGRLITVIDDSVLGGPTHRGFRDFIREHFVVRAVISLPGDAFQRSKARVKTSLLYLVKRQDENEVQPSVFMSYCSMVGVDDSPRQRPLPIDAVNREIARQEIARVTTDFQDFMRGEPSSEPWTVPASAIRDRLDVKACLLKPARRREEWIGEDATIKALHELAYDRFDASGPEDQDVLHMSEELEPLRTLVVRYDGSMDASDEINPGESSYSTMYRVHEGDIVFGHLSAFLGAVAVVPTELDGCVASSEYTVLRAREGYDPEVVWLLMRSAEARSDMLLLAAGMGRTRARWEFVQNVEVPLPSDEAGESARIKIADAEALERRALILRDEATSAIIDPMDLNSNDALGIVAAFKPPR